MVVSHFGDQIYVDACIESKDLFTYCKLEIDEPEHQSLHSCHSDRLSADRSYASRGNAIWLIERILRDLRVCPP
jgi:hypothetical protein